MSSTPAAPGKPGIASFRFAVWWSVRGPRFVLDLFCAALLAIALLYRGHSVESMDVRTYAQMIRAVSERGLPYWDNGPIDRFPELVVQWAVPKDGHVWGIYGPLYPYLAAPIFRLGGLERVSGFTFAMLAPLALVTFLFARRFVCNDWYAAFAGMLSVISTPIMAKALEVTPFPLIALLATLGMLFTVRLVESRVPKISTGIACGVTWAAATAGHALCFPMAVAALGVLGVAPDPGAAPSGGSLRERLRTQALVALERLGPALLAFVAAMFPVAYLNHLRFGSWNPVSYGPIAWTGLVNEELYKMNLVDQVRYSAVPGLFALVVLAAVVLARKRRLLVVAILAGAVAIAAYVPALREKFVRYAVVALGYLVDMSFIDMGAAYPPAPDGLGHYFAGWVPKATLQCTPLLVLAPLALRGSWSSRPPTMTRSDVPQRWPLLAILVPCAMLYVSFITRANLVYVDALGCPWVYIRYTFPALPGLLVASLVVVERLRLRVEHLLAAVVVATLVCLAFLETRDDTSLVKRVVLLVVPIVLGVVAFAGVLAAHRIERLRPPTRAIVGVLAGLGLAISLGHDLRANVDGKKGCDAYVNHLRSILPHRFALVGVLGQFDLALTTAATHDVQYADTLRIVGRYPDLHALLEHWHAEDRPVYFLWEGEPYNPWPDVTFERVSTQPDLFRAHLRPAPTASP
jgi:hypothetical protein